MPNDNNQTDTETELRDLKHKRGSIKANITRCRTYLSKLDLENIDIEQNERDNVESDYYDICSTIEEILGKRSEQNESQSIISNNNVVTSVQPLQLQLLILNLETFNGDYNKWIEFRDCFQAIVGKNATLSGIQKLCYLRIWLNRDFLKTIESLSLTDANYEVAWQALSKRYEEGKQFVETHVRKIINFPCLTKESSKDLRNLYDTVNNNLQALQILNQPVDTWDAILVPIITDELDQKSKREYEIFYIHEMDRNPSDNSSPSIKSLLDIIKKRYDLLESLEKDKSQSIRPAIKTTRNDYQYQSTSSSHLNTSTFSCYFCKRDHTIYKCIKFLKLSVPNRIQEIKRLKFCLNCLRPHDSSITKCLAIECKKCNRAHNTLLH
ncbi:hypothetical protein JTB14_009396 [Gonioctena quinquepunctata]|nr:hypothetical protein JTB14_009396 [Gonioctena quinquepunctata]